MQTVNKFYRFLGGGNTKMSKDIGLMKSFVMQCKNHL